MKMTNEFNIEEDESKIHVVQVVLNNLKESVKIESILLKEIDKMEKMGLMTTEDYKRIKIRQFEETFFALFLTRLVNNISKKKFNETYLDCVRGVKLRMSDWKRGDKKRMRKEYGKNEYTKKVLYNAIEKSFEKCQKYVSILENELKNVSK